MVATAGADASGGAIIGRACSDRRVQTTTFVVRVGSPTDEALSKTLAQVTALVADGGDRQRR